MQEQRYQEFSVNGEELLRKVKELIAAGNARRIIIKREGGDTLLEIPLTIGMVGALLLPTLAAVGAVAALVTKCTIVLERSEKVDTEQTKDQSSQETSSDTTAEQM